MSTDERNKKKKGSKGGGKGRNFCPTDTICVSELLEKTSGKTFAQIAPGKFLFPTSTN